VIEAACRLEKSEWDIFKRIHFIFIHGVGAPGPNLFGQSLRSNLASGRIKADTWTEIDWHGAVEQPFPETFHSSTGKKDAANEHDGWKWFPTINSRHIFRPNDPIGTKLFRSSGPTTADICSTQTHLKGVSAHVNYWDDPLISKLATDAVLSVLDTTQSQPPHSDIDRVHRGLANALAAAVQGFYRVSFLPQLARLQHSPWSPAVGEPWTSSAIAKERFTKWSTTWFNVEK
jgi:hypothetical protein